MTESFQPLPQALLKVAEREKSHLGQLRIFFGMSAGVGKTYAMLKAAQERKKEGKNIVIGVVETHGRKETEELTYGIPVIAKKKIEYRGVTLYEFDIDRCLQEKPEIVLLDELAHTNAPFSRHPKRYQDVLELLDHGIDVYTTLNVQHLESRKDLVEQITSTTIRETVPDSLLDKASHLELIDLTPQELLKRLHEGKIYLEEKKEQAIQNFFKQDYLTALREIALRVTAERVDQELQQFSETKKTSKPWATNERLLVAISHSPYSQTIIRATRRLAYNLEAPWMSVHVRTGVELSQEDEEQLKKNLNLSRQLGAEVIMVTDTNMVEAIKKIATQKNVTQMVVGRPLKREWKNFFLGGSLVDRLMRENLNIDIHVIRQEAESKHSKKNFHPFFPIHHINFKSYSHTLLFLLFIGGISAGIEPYLGYKAVGFIFLLGILFVGFLGSLGPVILAAIVSTLSWDYFFIPPQYTFFISEANDVIMCVTYFITAVIMGLLSTKVKLHEKLLRQRSERINILFDILHDLSISLQKNEFIERVIQRINKIFHCQSGIVLRGSIPTVFHEKYGFYPDSEKEISVALWTLNTGKMAGWSTTTLPHSTHLYIPLQSHETTYGVFIYHPVSKRKLTIEEEELLFSIVQQLGLSLDRYEMQSKIQDAEKALESEKLHETLLNSISHELKTPLTTIVGLSQALVEKKINTNNEEEKKLGKELITASLRLNHVVDNLLDMSRIQSGRLVLKKEWHDFRDLIGVVLRHLEQSIHHHPIHIQNLPKHLIEIDFILFEHALSNLLLNAALYTPENTDIFITTAQDNNTLHIIIEDNGPGLSPIVIPFLFEKFSQVESHQKQSMGQGIGLGLSIVKNIIELHGGSVEACNRKEGGARFTLNIPLGTPPSFPEPNEEG